MISIKKSNHTHENIIDENLFLSVSTILNNRLKESLTLFSSYTIDLIEPVLSNTKKISQNPDENYSSRVEIDPIIKNPYSIVIKSPPQFGLTVLAHHMINEAWTNGNLWIYLDARKVNKDSVVKHIEKEQKNLNTTKIEISCIVLDSWKSTTPGSKKLLRSLCHEYKETPIIIMQTIDDQEFLQEEPNENLNRDFSILHLLALPREQIRKIVAGYNTKRNICDDDILLKKITKDLDALNMHRTVVNCLTLLKASENNTDDNTINRTKVIETVLFVLFNIDSIPTYKIKPDLKDCEYVLGCFCEKLIRSNSFDFTHESFIKDLDYFCKIKLLPLDVSVVFDILYQNTIIIELNSKFIFRAAYWVYYFAARRMYFDPNFKNYILSEKRYISYPELIDFYTGIDRDRNEILEIFNADLEETCNIVQNKIGLPLDLNPLNEAKWNPSEESIEEMYNEINKDVKNSNLPTQLKDSYADRNYNQLRAYDQTISEIMHKYSLRDLALQVKSASRALRNSDYVDPDVKRKVMKNIMIGWKEVGKVIFALSPMLARNGEASFGGYRFLLDSSFSGDFREMVNQIFCANPTNIINFFKDDIYSKKLGPLIFEKLSDEKDKYIQHVLALLIASERPIEWRKAIENYIEQTPKNSFYLFDLITHLQACYKYDYASDQELSDIAYLLKMGYAKHKYGADKPNLVDMKKISSAVIPRREAETDTRDR